MRPARSPRFSCARRKAPARAFAGCRRRSADTVCSRRSTPTEAVTTSPRRRRSAKVDKTQPTQVGRALKQLHIEHIPSYSPQARGRIQRLWDTLQKRLPPLGGRTRSRRWRRPIAGWRRSTSSNTTPASPWPPQRKARPSFPSWANSTTSCASSRSASPAWTTPSATRAVAYKFRPTATGIISPRAPSGCSNTGTAPSPCSTDRAQDRPLPFGLVP